MPNAMLRKFENADGAVYFDTIYDGNLEVVFNAQPADVYAYLETHLLSLDHSVFVGKTKLLLTIPQYLEAI